MTKEELKLQALAYHRDGKPGKITKRLIDAFNEVAPKIGVHI